MYALSQLVKTGMYMYIQKALILSTIQDVGSTRSVMLSAKYFEPLASVPVGLLFMKIIREIDYFFQKIKEKRK